MNCKLELTEIFEIKKKRQQVIYIIKIVFRCSYIILLYYIVCVRACVLSIQKNEQKQRTCPVKRANYSPLVLCNVYYTLNRWVAGHKHIAYTRISPNTRILSSIKTKL